MWIGFAHKPLVSVCFAGVPVRPDFAEQNHIYQTIQVCSTLHQPACCSTSVQEVQIKNAQHTHTNKNAQSHNTHWLLDTSQITHKACIYNLYPCLAVLPLPPLSLLLFDASLQQLFSSTLRHQTPGRILSVAVRLCGRQLRECLYSTLQNRGEAY